MFIGFQFQMQNLEIHEILILQSDFILKFLKEWDKLKQGRTQRLYKEKKLLEKASFFEAVNIPAILLGYFKYKIFEVYQ
jgi:hypothetical protein